MQPRVWARSDDGRFEWVTLSAKYLPQAIEVYMKSFCVNENLSKVARLAQTEKGCEQFGELLTEIAQDGVSVIGVEIATGKVVGAGINKLNVSKLLYFEIYPVLGLHISVPFNGTVWIIPD